MEPGYVCAAQPSGVPPARGRLVLAEREAGRINSKAFYGHADLGVHRHAARRVRGPRPAPWAGRVGQTGILRPPERKAFNMDRAVIPSGGSTGTWVPAPCTAFDHKKRRSPREEAAF